MAYSHRLISVSRKPDDQSLDRDETESAVMPESPQATPGPREVFIRFQRAATDKATHDRSAHDDVPTLMRPTP